MVKLANTLVSNTSAFGLEGSTPSSGTKENMKIGAIKCRKCGDIIWSRAAHDFHWCTCESVAIDGGINPHKFVGNAEDYEQMELNLNITADEAYDDWNYSTNKLGTLHTDDGTEFIANV
jgi:hypothetical protein